MTEAGEQALLQDIRPSVEALDRRLSEFSRKLDLAFDACRHGLDEIQKATERRRESLGRRGASLEGDR